MIGKDEEVELPELNKILTKYMTGESKRPLWPYLTEALHRDSRSASSPYEEEDVIYEEFKPFILSACFPSDHHNHEMKSNL